METTAAAIDVIKTSMQTGFNGISADALSMLAIVVPIAIGIAGVIFVSKKAIGWFKGMAK